MDQTLMIADYGKFMDLAKERKAILQKEKEIKQEMEQMESILINNLLSNNMTKLNIGDSMTYIAEDVKPIIHDKDKAIEALKQNGYQDYVSENYSWQQIKRFIKDVIESEESLPECFDGIIDFKKESKLRVRKA